MVEYGGSNDPEPFSDSASPEALANVVQQSLHINPPPSASAPAPAPAPVQAPVQVQAPVYAPVHAPVYAPVQAPVYAPVYAPAPAPVFAPVYAPVQAQAPVYAPVSAPVHHGGNDHGREHEHARAHEQEHEHEHAGAGAGAKKKKEKKEKKEKKDKKDKKGSSGKDKKSKRRGSDSGSCSDRSDSNKSNDSSSSSRSSYPTLPSRTTIADMSTQGYGTAPQAQQQQQQSLAIDYGSRATQLAAMQAQRTASFGVAQSFAPSVPRQFWPSGSATPAPAPAPFSYPNQQQQQQQPYASSYGGSVSAYQTSRGGSGPDPQALARQPSFVPPPALAPSASVVGARVRGGQGATGAPPPPPVYSAPGQPSAYTYAAAPPAATAYGAPFTAARAAVSFRAMPRPSAPSPSASFSESSSFYSDVAAGLADADAEAEAGDVGVGARGRHAAPYGAAAASSHFSAASGAPSTAAAAHASIVVSPRFTPQATPLCSASGATSIAFGDPRWLPFDDRAHLGLRGDARVAELRVWSDSRVHALQLRYDVSPGGEGGLPLLDGSVAGTRRGEFDTLCLGPGDSIAAVAGRWGPDSCLEVLIVGTARGQQHRFGGWGLPDAQAAQGHEFVLRVPERHRVVGFRGAVSPALSSSSSSSSDAEGGIVAIGAYTTLM